MASTIQNSWEDIEKGRYHLYVCHGCPYAHRATVYIALKGLEEVISVDVVDPVLNTDVGWEFTPDKGGCTPDRVNGKKYLKEIYQMSHPNYTGRITVPVLFDKKTFKIVSNESADIMRFLNESFDSFCSMKCMQKLNFYRGDQIKDIEKMNRFLDREVSYMGIYTNQQHEYEERVTGLFAAFDKLEVLLSKQRFLLGEALTQSDIRLFVFLIRFDIAYSLVFKCFIRRLCDYKHLWGYVRDIYQLPRMSSTVNFDHIKDMYWLRKGRNPSGIVPISPMLNFQEYSGRDIAFSSETLPIHLQHFSEKRDYEESLKAFFK